MLFLRYPRLGWGVRILLVGLVWGFCQVIALVFAVSQGSLIPVNGTFTTGGPVSPSTGAVGPPLMNPITFTQGLAGTVSIILIVAYSFLAGYFLADIGPAVKALLISQTLDFALTAYIFFGRPSAISSLPDTLQAFFLLSYLAYFLLAMILCLAGAFVGERFFKS